MHALPPKRRRARRTGTLAVEFALVAPVFFLLFFGMVDVGRALMVRSLLDNSSRIACRTGIVQGKTNADVHEAVAKILQVQGISGYSTSITVNGSPMDVAYAQAGDVIAVTVSVPVSNVAWMPGLRYVTGTLTGSFALPRG